MESVKTFLICEVVLLTIRSHCAKTLRENLSIISSMRVRLHDDALLTCINFAVLVDSRHELVVSLLGLDFVGEPPFEEGRLFLVEIVYVASVS